MILLLSSDLMFQSRISSTARAAGKACLTERSVAKLIERVTEPNAVSMILIDLTLRTIDLALEIPLIQNAFPEGKILAFGPHVDVERLQAAEEAGADLVLTRGQMDRDLVAILQGT